MDIINISRDQKNYIAGIIDGEGHFYLAQHKNGRGEIRPQARIVITNTNLELIQWLKTTLGGNICLLKKQKETSKQCYQWRIAGRKARELAFDVKPYLIVKKDQVLRII